ncbi:hypothetical protein [Nocardia sp. NPDC046763]|uniref:hypothetical protein n=1 Tax=Nocardia sp. NPDC046763 TaxID=3155256 RepID=UPI0033F63BBA
MGTGAAAAGFGGVVQQRAGGQPVQCHSYPGADHRGVLDASCDDALAWVDTRFGR